MIVTYIIDILSLIFNSLLNYHVFAPCLAFALLICIFSIIRRLCRP